MSEATDTLVGRLRDLDDLVTQARGDDDVADQAVEEMEELCFEAANALEATTAALVILVGHSGYTAEGVADDYEFALVVKAKDYRAARAALFRATSQGEPK